MVRTETVRARVTPSLKRSAEGIFAELGIMPSQAIVMFYKQVELHRGLPFEMKVPVCKLENSAKFSDKRMDEELERGYASYRSGNVRSIAESRDAFRRRHGKGAA